MEPNVIRRRWVPGMGEIDNLCGTAFTGESGAHTFRVMGWNGGAQIPLSGDVTATFLAGNNTLITLAGSIEDGEAVVTLDGACYAAEGRFVLSVYLADGQSNICVYCGVGVVTSTSADAVYDAANLIPSVAELISQATVLREETAYQLSESGSSAPTGTWLADQPVVPQGMYLWIRRTLVFKSGATTVLYVPARNGLDGNGSVRMVNNYSPDGNGNVTLPFVNKNGDTMTGPLYMANLSSIRSDDNLKYLRIEQGDGTRLGALSFNSTTRVFYMFEDSPDSNYHENFVFPAPDTGITANANYDILTSKRTAGLYSNSAAIASLADLVAYTSDFATGDRLIVRAGAALMGDLAGSSSYAGTAIIIKGSASNAYYFAFSRGTAAYGNISITNGTVSVKNILATS